MRVSYLFACIFVAGASVFFASLAQASDDCAAVYLEIPLDKAKGNANVFANAVNQESSVRAKTSRMINAAVKSSLLDKRPEVSCPAHCVPANRAVTVLRTTPSKFLSDYADKDKCENYLKETRQNPLRYLDRQFLSQAELNEWSRSFTQGKGDDGRDLYNRCDGKCSPQYSYFIEFENAQYRLDVEVVCGPARDKEDNTYDLETATRWNCVPSESTSQEDKK
jgi:hypothetical protein